MNYTKITLFFIIFQTKYFIQEYRVFYLINNKNVFKGLNIYKTFLNPILTITKRFQVNIYIVMFDNI